MSQCSKDLNHIIINLNFIKELIFLEKLVVV